MVGVMRWWIWTLECLVVVARSFVDFSGFMDQQCCGGGGWWFMGCYGSVVGLIGWFGGVFLFFRFGGISMVVLMACFW